MRCYSRQQWDSSEYSAAYLGVRYYAELRSLCPVSRRRLSFHGSGGPNVNYGWLVFPQTQPRNPRFSALLRRSTRVLELRVGSSSAGMTTQVLECYRSQILMIQGCWELALPEWRLSLRQWLIKAQALRSFRITMWQILNNSSSSIEMPCSVPPGGMHDGLELDSQTQ